MKLQALIDFEVMTLWDGKEEVMNLKDIVSQCCLTFKLTA
jgi:hypothetical protein